MEEQTKTLVVNLYGGPGTGKSTTAAGTFSFLKQDGINSELVMEFAKDKVWEESYKTLDNQIYVFGKQFHRIYRLLGKVDVVITDSPILLSLYYGKDNTPQSFKDLVIDTFKELNTFDVFLNRKKKYNPKGRLQTEEKARDIDVELKNLLDNVIPNNYITMDADMNASLVLKNLIVGELKKQLKGKEEND